MRISSITKNAGKACNNRLYRHIRTFEKIVKNYFVIYSKDDENPQNIGLYKLEIATEEEVNKENFVWDHAEMGIFVEEEKETVP